MDKTKPNIDHQLSEFASKSPSYYIKKRLFRNKPAFVGIILIVLAHLLAIFGYLIMPDSTPNANDGAVQIQKLPFGSSVQFLKIRKHIQVEKVSILTKMLFGQESEYIIVPINKYKINELEVEIEDYIVKSNSKIRRKTYSIPEVTLALFVGEKSRFSNGEHFEVKGEKINYYDFKGNLKSIGKEELLKMFLDNNLEKRTFYLGTDKSGRDIASRLLLGTRVSLSIGFVSVLISIVVGVILGAFGGFLGGKIDDFIMWLMTVVWSIPGIMLVIAISLALQSKGIWVAFVAVGLTMWVEVARVIRGQIMSIKEKLYVESAKALGFNDIRIIFKHILPNTVGTIVVIANSNFASAILLEAGLSFLGLGVKPPMPSWGMMVKDGFNVIGSDGSWGLVLFPGLSIMLMVLSFNLLGNGLRDALDPKTHLN